MRKFWMLSLTLILLLTGCGKETPQETTQPQLALATEPSVTETVPETLPSMEEAEILADRVPALLKLLPQGEKLELVDEYDEDHYVVKTPEGYGLVQKNLVRTGDAEPYESWKGYAMWSMAIYDNLYLTGEGKTLVTNQEVTVLEDLGTCYLVNAEGVTGYARKNLVSKWPSGGGGGGGSSDGGSSGGGGGGGGSTGQDGGDIVLGISGGIVPLMELVPQEGTVSGTLITLIPDTPLDLGWFHRGDLVQVVTDPDFPDPLPGYRTVYLKDLYVYVEENLLRPRSVSSYVQWEGFAAPNARAYDNFRLAGEPLKYVYTNAKVQVLQDLGSSYLVTVGEETFYMAKDAVSETQVPVYSGGGGSSDGGGGGSSGGSSGPEWSDPIY